MLFDKLISLLKKIFPQREKPGEFHPSRTLNSKEEEKGYSPAEEEEVRKRLEGLGYTE